MAALERSAPTSSGGSGIMGILGMAENRVGAIAEVDISIFECCSRLRGILESSDVFQSSEVESRIRPLMAENSGFQVAGDASIHYQTQVERLMTPFVDRLIEVAVRPGDTVLDVACGTGFATRAALSAVGHGGSVVGTDINPGMIETARAHDKEDAISWQEASALDLPFPDGAFDAVLCQQGLQFFPHASAGLREMARVTTASGRIAATVWAPISQCPFFEAEFGILAQECGADPALWARSFAEGGRDEVRGWFIDAGMEEVEIETVEATVALPPIPEYVSDHAKALPWAGRLYELSDDKRARVVDLIDQKLERFRTDTGAAVPFVSYLASATLETA